MAHPVTWFHITATDVKAAQKFYKKVFGWKMTPMPGAGRDGGSMVTAEKPGIAGGIAPPMDGSGKSSVAIYVDTDSIARSLKTVAKAGGTVVMQPMELPGGMGTIAGFIDPVGNFTGLWQKAKKTARKAAKKAAKKPAKKPAAKRARKAAA
jgi:uncharacterized protein